MSWVSMSGTAAIYGAGCVTPSAAPACLPSSASATAFFELHQKFFIWQIVIFILGGAIGLLLTNKLWVVFLTSCVFGLNSILILMHRSRKEDRMASIILKGA